MLAHRLARAHGIARLDGLATAMLLAAAVVTLLAGWSAAPALVDPVAVVAGVGVGIASSVIPYVFDQLAMARLSRSTYSLMVALLPATAIVVGVVVLAQIPTPVEGLAVRSSSRGRRIARGRRAMQPRSGRLQGSRAPGDPR